RAGAASAWRRDAPAYFFKSEISVFSGLLWLIRLGLQLLPPFAGFLALVGLFVVTNHSLTGQLKPVLSASAHDRFVSLHRFVPMNQEWRSLDISLLTQQCPAKKIHGVIARPEIG